MKMWGKIAIQNLEERTDKYLWLSNEVEGAY